MTKWIKKDFEIKSVKSGSRLAGRENLYEYYIVVKKTGQRLTDKIFYKKAEAEKWLADCIRYVNEKRV